MNLLINASNVRFGGGLSVAHNLLRSLIPLRKEDFITIIAPINKGYEHLGSFDNVELCYVPDKFHHSWVNKYYTNNTVFSKVVKEKGIDKVISLGNIAFPSLGKPNLLLIQNAWLLYPESAAWKQIPVKNSVQNKLMNIYTTHHLKHASAIALQTPIMKERFQQQYPQYGKQLFIVPNAVANNECCNTTMKQNPVKRLLFLSKYYAHKNFEVLIPLAALIKKKGIQLKISVTIDANESADATAFLNRIRKEQLDDIIETIGHIPTENINTVCREHDGMLFPTLLESFSGTYAEAMHNGLPIFTSNLDFAKGICDDAAFYFNPFDAVDILSTITTAFSNPSLIAENAAKGKMKVSAMPGWDEIASNFSQIIDTFQ